MRTLLGIIAALGVLSFSQGAFAQSTSVVLSSCGTASYTATATSGDRQYPTQDTTGAACAAATTPVGSANFTPAQVSVTTSATLIVAARAGRTLVTVENTTTTDIYIGGASVTTSTGHLLPGTKGASLTIPYTGALYGIVASGSATVTEAEVY